MNKTTYKKALRHVRQVTEVAMTAAVSAMHDVVKHTRQERDDAVEELRRMQRECMELRETNRNLSTRIGELEEALDAEMKIHREHANG